MGGPSFGILWVSPSHGKIDSMKKFLSIMLVLLGIGAVVYVLTHKKDDARHSWDETLAQVPEPDPTI